MDIFIEKYPFDLSKYEKVSDLGHGSFGQVHGYKLKSEFEATELQPKFVAGKQLFAKLKGEFFDKDSVLGDLSPMLDLKPHENVVKVFGCAKTGGVNNNKNSNLIIVMEYCDGNLSKHLTNRKHALKKFAKVKIAKDIIKAIRHIHDAQEIHRDIKPSNFLIKGKDPMIVKLADFGMAKNLNCAKGDSEDVTVTAKGTRIYMAPEELQGLANDGKVKNSKKCDIFSLGCVLYWLHTAKPPFTENDLFGYCPDVLEDALKRVKSKVLENVLKKMLDPKPSKRPSIEELYHIFCTSLSSPFLSCFSLPGKVQLPSRFEDLLLNDRDAFPLHFAAFKGDKIAVKKLAKKRQIDWNKRDAIGLTALHYAVMGEKPAMIELLLGLGSIVDAIDSKYGITPLWLASFKGFQDCVRVLLEGGANKSIKDTQTKSYPIHVTAQEGHAFVVDRLSSKNGERRKDDCTPMMLAAAFGHMRLVVRLLARDPKSGDSADKDNRSALWLSVLGGHDRIVEFLLNKTAKVDVQEFQSGMNALHLSAYLGNITILESILGLGQCKVTDKTSKGNLTAVTIAAAAGNLAAVDVLMNKPIATFLSMKGHSSRIRAQNPPGSLPKLRTVTVEQLKEFDPADGLTPLMRAASDDQSELIKVFLAKGANVDMASEANRGSTAFHIACDKGHLNTVHALMEVGRANVNVQNLDGQTGFILAVLNNHVSLMAYLVKRAAIEIDHEDCYNRTALWHAASKGHVEAVDLLLFLGANARHSGQYESTPLHAAAQEGKLQVVKSLIEKDPSLIDSEDTSGCTPFYRAVLKNRFTTLSYLHVMGADVNRCDDVGRSALWQAACHGYANTVDTLIGYGADGDLFRFDDKTTPLHLDGKERFDRLKRRYRAEENCEEIAHKSVPNIEEKKKSAWKSFSVTMKRKITKLRPKVDDIK